MYFLVKGGSLCGLASRFDQHTTLRLARLWIFGQQFLMPKLQDSALKVLTEVYRVEGVGVEETRVAFEQTAEDSPLRRVIVEQAVEDIARFYGCNLIPEQEFLHGMSMIPGFFSAFTKELFEDYDEKGGHPTFRVRDIANYYVDSDSKA